MFNMINAIRVLIIEDEVDLGRAVKEIMTYIGAETTLVHDGQVALDWLAQHVPDCVILDLHLPNVSGLDILNAIRADERLKETRVFVVTADTERLSLAAQQADATLSKPYRVAELVDLLRKFRLRAR
ncbi:MAG: response regulator [Anaerolineae bacterium]|nr:response regulator [Anaerolineae bacterium]